MAQRLSIGEFSCMTHLSVRTLRRYHDAGLLEPAEVDDWTGYRYYDVEQIPVAQTIRRYRELEMPVREIGELLTASEDEQTELIARHLDRLEKQLAQTQDAVSSLRRLLRGSTTEVAITQRVQPARLVAAISETVRKNDVLSWYTIAMSELDEVLVRSGSAPNGPAGGVYANELYSDDIGELMVYLPVDEPVSGGRVESQVMPAVELASAVHVGNFSDLDVTYGRLGRWVADQGQTIAGPVHERYLVGPRDDASEASWRTEIGWPVRTTG